MGFIRKYVHLVLILLALYFAYRAYVSAEHRTVYVSMVIIYLASAVVLYFVETCVGRKGDR